MFKDESSKPKTAPASSLPANLLKQFKNDDDRFMITERFTFLLSLLCTVLAVVTLVFYKNKRALYLAGIAPYLHVFKHYLLQLAKRFTTTSSSIVNAADQASVLVAVHSFAYNLLPAEGQRRGRQTRIHKRIHSACWPHHLQSVRDLLLPEHPDDKSENEFIDVYNEINGLIALRSGRFY